MSNRLYLGMTRADAQLLAGALLEASGLVDRITKMQIRFTSPQTMGHAARVMERWKCVEGQTVSVNKWRYYLQPNSEYFQLPGTVADIPLAVIDDYHDRIEGNVRVAPEVMKTVLLAQDLFTGLRPLLVPGRTQLARENGQALGGGLEWRLAAII